jgi:hypothetical protein
MNETSMAKTSMPSVYATSVFWERMWRSAGLQCVALFILAYAIYGYQPPVHATASKIVAFYDGHRMRILIAAAISGFAILNLMWFAAALRTALADAGKDGWGAAATASSAALGGSLLLLIAIGTSLAMSIAGSGNDALATGLNTVAWSCFVLTSFPRAMLIMAGSFGFWRAGSISNAKFTVCVGAVVLVLLSGTTWAGDGVWAPHGVYSRFVSPAIGLVWIAVVSQFLLARIPPTRAGW